MGAEYDDHCLWHAIEELGIKSDFEIDRNSLREVFGKTFTFRGTYKFTNEQVAVFNINTSFHFAAYVFLDDDYRVIQSRTPLFVDRETGELVHDTNISDYDDDYTRHYVILELGRFYKFVEYHIDRISDFMTSKMLFANKQNEQDLDLIYHHLKNLQLSADYQKVSWAHHKRIEAKHLEILEHPVNPYDDPELDRISDEILCNDDIFIP